MGCRWAFRRRRYNDVFACSEMAPVQQSLRRGRRPERHKLSAVMITRTNGGVREIMSERTSCTLQTTCVEWDVTPRCRNSFLFVNRIEFYLFIRGPESPPPLPLFSSSTWPTRTRAWKLSARWNPRKAAACDETASQSQFRVAAQASRADRLARPVVNPTSLPPDSCCAVISRVPLERASKRIISAREAAFQCLHPSLLPQTPPVARISSALEDVPSDVGCVNDVNAGDSSKTSF